MPAICAYARIGRERRDTEGDIMSKSLQRGIIFAVCVALVLALSLTLVFFAGGGDKNILSAPEGQVSGVADAAANAYEHGTDSGRRPAGTYTSVSTGAEFYNAIKSNTKDILLTGNITLTSSVSTSGNLYWNDGSQCFMQNTPFSHKIYGAGYTITVQGPHTSSEGMQMNSADSHDYGGLISNLQSNGAIYDVKVIITKGFAVQTWETSVSWTGATTDYWLNVGGLVGYMSGGSQIDNVYVELADSTVRLASFKYISGGSPPQYVRAGAIVGEMGAKATITNVTVNNKGKPAAQLPDRSFCSGSDKEEVGLFLFYRSIYVKIRSVQSGTAAELEHSGCAGRDVRQQAVVGRAHCRGAAGTHKERRFADNVLLRRV